MPKVTVYTITGEKKGEIELADSVFNVAENIPLIHQVAVGQQANARKVLAHTKDRGEVRGGGKKPWKQKGTGRARHGSNRSPLWVGGGITFGPTKERNFEQRINKKMSKKALACVLSDKVRNDQMIVVDSFSVTDGKTKNLHGALDRLPWKEKTAKRALIALEKSDPQVIRSARNIKEVFVIEARNVNVVDALRYPHLVITTAAVKQLEERLQ